MSKIVTTVLFLLITQFSWCAKKSGMVTVTVESAFHQEIEKIVVKNCTKVEDVLPERPFKYAIKAMYVPFLTLPKGSVKDKINLTSLSLDNGDINSVEPGAFQNVPALTFLDLSGNRIMKIDKGIFNDLALVVLDLEYNMINYIHPDAFDGMINLVKIELSSNQLYSWDNSWYQGTPSLTTIDFRYNKLTEIPPKAFRYVNKERETQRPTKLQNVNFGNNKINFVNPRAFDRIYQLSNFSLAFNNFTSLPNDFGDLRKITNLYFGSNPLEQTDFEDLSVFKYTTIDNLYMYLENCIDNDTYFRIRKYVKRVLMDRCYSRVSRIWINSDFDRNIFN